MSKPYFKRTYTLDPVVEQQKRLAELERQIITLQRDIFAFKAKIEAQERTIAMLYRALRGEGE